MNIPVLEEPVTDQIEPHPDISHLGSGARAQLYYSIMLAEIAEQNGDRETALSNYSFAAETSGSPKLAEKAAFLAERLGDSDQAKPMAKLWLKLEPESISARELVLLGHLRDGERTEAMKQLNIIMLQLSTSPHDTFVELLRIANSDENVDFIEFYTSGLRKVERPAPLALALGVLELDQDDKALDTAIDWAEQAIAYEPNFLHAIITKSRWLTRTDTLAAEQYLEEEAERLDWPKDILMAKGRLEYAREGYAEASESFARVVNKTPQDPDANYFLAVSLLNDKRFDESLDVFDRLLEFPEPRPAVPYFCGRAAQGAKEFSAAVKCFRQVPVGQFFVAARQHLARLYLDRDELPKALDSIREGQSQVYGATRKQLIYRELRLLLDQEQWNEADLRLTEEYSHASDDINLHYFRLELTAATKSDDELIAIYQNDLETLNAEQREDALLFIVGLLQERESYPLALRLLNESLATQPDNVALLYSRALLMEPIGDVTQMEIDLRRILELDPEHINALNALGYTLADQNVSLAEARELIEKAYAKDPENIAIIDSMGWVQFRLGNYPLALEYLKQAYDASQAADIAAHLGEVYWVIGERDKAREIWSNALQSEPDNRYIRDTLKRLLGESYTDLAD